MFLEFLLFLMIWKNNKDIDQINARLDDIDIPHYENDNEKLEDLK